ncbi:MAG: hypothetical protein ACSHXF_03540 [Aquaticitalea sp.]
MMRIILTIITVLFIVQYGFSQDTTCNCSKDLDFVIAESEDTPSFKSQIKDDAYLNDFIKKLKISIESDSNIELNCLGYLQKYLKIVKDNHLYISNSNTEIDYSAFFPIESDIEGYIIKAKSDTTDELTGIYSLLDLYKVAVVKKTEDTYQAILLETTNEKWTIGQTKFTLRKTPAGLEGIFYDGVQSPVFINVEYKKGRLFPERWIKEDKKEQYTFNPYDLDDEKLQYKKLDVNLHYVRLGNFSGMTSNYNRAKALLKTLEKEVTTGDVIIDLRNNGGGGPRTSDLFKKFFKKNKKDLNIYVIQNIYCGSDCEQFLLKLKDQQTVKTFGENTRGALAYGYGNYSKPSLKTPCNDYLLGLTTSKYEKYLPYEVLGISPDVYLNFQEDWINQVLNSIDR